MAKKATKAKGINAPAKKKPAKIVARGVGPIELGIRGLLATIDVEKAESFSEIAGLRSAGGARDMLEVIEELEIALLEVRSKVVQRVRMLRVSPRSRIGQRDLKR